MSREDLINKARRLLVTMVVGDTDVTFAKMSDEELTKYIEQLEAALAALNEEKKNREVSKHSYGSDASQKQGGDEQRISSPAPKEQKW